MEDYWMVQVPIKDLLALCGLKDELDRVNADNLQLRREIEGLRNIQYKTLETLGDLKKTIRAI